jgi:hypothetical protein
MAGLRREQGRLTEAETLHREVLQVRRRTQPEGDPAIGSALVMLGSNLMEQGKHGEAEPLLRECLEIRRRALPEGHWLIFNTMSVVGESLAGQAKFAEAEPLLLEGNDKLQENAQAIPEPVREQRLREALERIVEFYDAWHEAEPGKGYDQKAAEWRAKLPEENGE